MISFWRGAVRPNQKIREDVQGVPTAVRVQTAADVRIVPAAGAAGYARRIRLPLNLQ